MKTARNLVAFLMILLLPSFAYANAGTPLMIGTNLHLVFGNFFLGIFEGLLLGFVFGAPKGRAILLLIVANYVSAWLGGMCILGAIISHVSIDIENVRFWFWMLLFLAFLVTLIIEFPFVFFSLWKREHLIRKSIVATLVIHVVSYLLLLGWYLPISHTSMMNDLEVVAAEQMQLPEGYDLYYISPDGKTVIQADLYGKTENTFDSTMKDGGELLFAFSNEQGKYDLYLCRPNYGHENEEEEVILEDFSSFVPEELTRVPEAEGVPDGLMLPYGRGEVPKLEATNDWTCRIGFWAGEGIWGENEASNLRFRYAMEIPFLAWSIRCPVLLPGDFIVFQFGRDPFQLGGDQICIIDLQKRQIALIARGRSPFVAKAKEEH